MRNTEAADMVGNIEDLREMRWAINELRRLAREESDLVDKHRLADLIGGNIDLLDRVWRQVEQVPT
jgi:hypothetical protein